MDGLGVMISNLGGNSESVAVFTAAIGKTIQEVKIVNNKLVFRFSDATAMALYDDGQSCCESRYMSCDDGLDYYAGAVLQSAEMRDGPLLPAEYDEHDSQFLVVTTSKGVFTVVNHVEHNGCYGGFAIRAKAVE